jgi:DNA repair protein RecN (Recombination protein N)
MQNRAALALGILIGGRFTSDLLKTGAERGFIEGLFSVSLSPPLAAALAGAGIEGEIGNGAEGEDGAQEDTSPEMDMIIRRELSAPGRNKIFINNQLATQSLLRDLRPFLVDIHGQGDQQTLFSPETHLELLDAFTANAARLAEVGEAYHHWLGRKRELDQLQRDEAERFQLVDILKFQIEELERSQLAIGEDATLEEERRLLLNFEKLTALSDESYRLIYEDNEAALTRLRQAMKRHGTCGI